MSRRNLFRAVGAIIFLVVGAVAGFILGSYMSGHSPDFVFWTWRGTEAVGWIGMVGGSILGLILGAFLGSKIAEKWGV